MQINNLKLITPKFTSNNIDNSYGFDDSISQERRQYLREHILENSMPYYDIFENSGRLEKYELKKLISALCGQRLNQDSLDNIFKPKIQVIKTPATNVPMPPDGEINYELIESIPSYNLELVSKKMKVYRGESLVGKSYALKTLKEAGIERVVDLIGYEYLKDDCARLGLDYFKYPMTPYTFMQNAMFNTKDEKKQLFFTHCRRFGYQGKEANAYVQKMILNWEENKNSEIDNFVKFIQTMQKGKLYIGCEYGTYTTDNALMLNAFFNPLYVRTKKYITSYNHIYTSKLEKLYQNLKPEHKELMGWTEEFEHKLVENLKRISR